jgi:trimeric autotransporter adhesin
MRRFATLAVLFCFTIPFGISISGCSKGTPITYCTGDTGPIVGQAVAITLNPKLTGISLNFGQFGQVAAPSAVDCKGNSVSITSYTYGIFDANGHATTTIADVVPTGTNAGKLCGGTWNRNSGGGVADFTTCNATNITGEVFVVASASGVSSNPLPIFIHPTVTSVVLGKPTPQANCSTDPDPSSNCCPIAAQTGVALFDGSSCISQGQTAQLAVRAYANASNTPANNITCSVGHFTYTPQSSSILTIDDNGVATAQQPGSTIITANIANAGSSAGFFSTCPPAKIALTVPGSTITPPSATVNQNVTQPLLATVTDTKGSPITGLSLTYLSTQPNTIPVSSAGSVTPTFPGAADITAICQPPSCNPSPLNQIGLFGNGTPVASNPVAITTPGTNSTLLYVASTNSRYIASIDFSNPAATTTPPSKVQLPYVPNSMIISQDGSSIYLGSANELMVFNATTNSLTKEDPSVAGKVLAVSPDGTTVIITDPVRQLIYLYPTGSATATGVPSYGGVATHAEFTPDSQTVYITTGTPGSNGTVTPGNTLLVHSSFTGWTAVNLSSPAPDVSVTVPSVGAYLAGSPTTAVSYCPSTTVNSNGTTTNTFYPVADSASVVMDLIKATDDGLHILGATVTGGPTMNDLVFSTALPPPPSSGQPVGACPMVVPSNFFTGQRASTKTVPLPGVTATAINDLVPTSDAKYAFVAYTGTGSLPAYSTATGAATSIALTGGASSPIAAAISTDNSTLFVGTTGDNLVHLINVNTLKDTTTVLPNGSVQNGIAPGLTSPPDSNGQIKVVTPNLIVQHPRKSTS